MIKKLFVALALAVLVSLVARPLMACVLVVVTNPDCVGVQVDAHIDNWDNTPYTISGTGYFPYADGSASGTVSVSYEGHPEWAESVSWTVAQPGSCAPTPEPTSTVVPTIPSTSTSIPQPTSTITPVLPTPTPTSTVVVPTATAQPTTTPIVDPVDPTSTDIPSTTIPTDVPPPTSIPVTPMPSPIPSATPLPTSTVVPSVTPVPTEIPAEDPKTAPAPGNACPDGLLLYRPNAKFSPRMKAMTYLAGGMECHPGERGGNDNHPTRMFLSADRESQAPTSWKATISLEALAGVFVTLALLFVAFLIGARKAIQKTANAPEEA